VAHNQLQAVNSYQFPFRNATCYELDSYALLHWEDILSFSFCIKCNVFVLYVRVIIDWSNVASLFALCDIDFVSNCVTSTAAGHIPVILNCMACCELLKLELSLKPIDKLLSPMVDIVHVYSVNYYILHMLSFVSNSGTDIVMCYFVSFCLRASDCSLLTDFVTDKTLCSVHLPRVLQSVSGFCFTFHSTHTCSSKKRKTLQS